MSLVSGVGGWVGGDNNDNDNNDDDDVISDLEIWRSRCYIYKQITYFIFVILCIYLISSIIYIYIGFK